MTAKEKLIEALDPEGKYREMLREEEELAALTEILRIIEPSGRKHKSAE
jgi:hypothetical protein